MSCRHRQSWLIAGAAYEWCYQCGAFRLLRELPNGALEPVVPAHEDKAMSADVDNTAKPWVCEDCAEDQDASETRHHLQASADEAFWTGVKWHRPLCDGCKAKRENAEPSGSDGEAFRGGEAAAYQAEQQHVARRLK